MSNVLFFLDKQVPFSTRFLAPAFYWSDPKIPLLYNTSHAYWMHYRFLGEAHGFGFADSRVLRINLMNIFSCLVNYRSATEEALSRVRNGERDYFPFYSHGWEENNLAEAANKTVETLYLECLEQFQVFINASFSSPVCYWSCRDDAESFIAENLAEIGPLARVANFLALPHIADRNLHIFQAEAIAQIRYEKALAKKQG